MNQQLIDRMLAAREQWVELGAGKAIKIRRPDELQLLTMRRGAEVLLGVEMMVSQAFDWRGFAESDLIPSGASDPVPFDREAWRLWLGDHRDCWPIVSDALGEAIEAHRSKFEAAEKN
jgi:hypothetical protein